MPKKDYYEIQGDKLVRKRRHCPKCGEGVFLAEHKDRHACGGCGYTEFNKKEPKPQDKTKAEPKMAEAKPEPEPAPEPIAEEAEAAAPE